jgi:uncharacterized protein YjiS (DUF1127 family)
MSLKFRGSFSKLQKCVAHTQFYGVWRKLPSGHRQYRTNDGAILNWWQSSGTINFQGTDPGRTFENAFIAEAEAKGRLIGKDVGQAADPFEQRGNLRRRIEQARADIARLNWRALRDERAALKNLVADKLEDVATIIQALV